MNRYSTNWWSLVLIYRPREDERLSWPCWLTYSGRYTQINGCRSCDDACLSACVCIRCLHWACCKANCAVCAETTTTTRVTTWRLLTSSSCPAHVCSSWTISCRPATVTPATTRLSWESAMKVDLAIQCIASRTFLKHTFLDSHLIYWASFSFLAQLLDFIVFFLFLIFTSTYVLFFL